MIKEKDSSITRVILSGMVLVLFFGALLAEYWPDLVPLALRIFNSARSVGAQRVESAYFEVLNNSNASASQVADAVQVMENQYSAIVAFTGRQPSGKFPVLITNGQSPAMTDGRQIMLNYHDGSLDINLVPMYLVWLIEDIPLNPQEGLALAGGYALQVVEAAGLGAPLTFQSLDEWTVLLRQKNAFLPLEQAWQAGMPDDEESGYLLMRAALQTGSFLRWLAQTNGREAAQSLAHGAPIAGLTGRSLAENEAAWLDDLSHKNLRPSECRDVIPEDNLFILLCEHLEAAQVMDR